MLAWGFGIGFVVGPADWDEVFGCWGSHIGFRFVHFDRVLPDWASDSGLSFCILDAYVWLCFGVAGLGFVCWA